MKGLLMSLFWSATRRSKSSYSNYADKRICGSPSQRFLVAHLIVVQRITRINEFVVARPNVFLVAHLIVVQRITRINELDKPS